MRTQGFKKIVLFNDPSNYNYNYLSLFSESLTMWLLLLYHTARNRLELIVLSARLERRL